MKSPSRPYSNLAQEGKEVLKAMIPKENPS